MESYAIIYAIKKLDHYLKGSHFIVHTDHRNLVYIKGYSSAKIIRWSLLLQEYNFELSLVAGKDNIIADTLSRAYPDDLTHFKVEPLPDSEIGFTDYCSLNSKYEHPSPLLPHLDLKIIATPTAVPVCLINVPKSLTEDIKTKVNRYHNDVFGHNKTAQTAKMLNDHGLFWPGMLDDIASFIQTYPKCSKTRQHHVPANPSSRNLDIMKKHHNRIFGHHEIDQTLKLLRLNNHRWNGIKSHVVDFIHSCPHCQKNNQETRLPSLNSLLLKYTNLSCMPPSTPSVYYRPPNMSS